jgi:UDP-glucose 4-epimerase
VSDGRAVTACWVIGQRGLLGSALARCLPQHGQRLLVLPQPLAWGDDARLAAQLDAAVRALADVAAGGAWRIFWAAGIGTMSSAADGLRGETAALGHLLQALANEPRLNLNAGALALASSAGAIWAGTLGEAITESTTIAPTTAYAHAKLGHEALLAAFALAHPATRVLSARISTLYGVGQAANKKQGLLTHLARNIVRGQSTSVFVSLDTIRDYIHADDAAAEIASALELAQPAAQPVVKIVASERPATIAEIVTIFKRIARRNPRIVASQAPASRLYLRRQQFRSTVLPQARKQPPRSLLIGISQLMAAERTAYAVGA